MYEKNIHNNKDIDIYNIWKVLYMDTRKVQQVSVSTFVISLPREWTKEIGLKKGDIVTLKREDDGTLRVFPGIPREDKKKIRYLIHADLCREKGLLSRILTGSYLLGHDTLQVGSNKDLSPGHLEEIRSTTKKLMGLGIVEQTLNKVIVQSFIDPTKFSIYGLVKRLHVITSSMQNAAIKALVEHRPELAKEVFHMENEVDRIYWLIARQLLLAIRRKEVGKKIGLEAPIHLMGNRVIAVCLERIADYIQMIANGVLQTLRDDEVPPKLLNDIRIFSDIIHNLGDKTFKAFFNFDAKVANEAIEAVELLDMEQKKVETRLVNYFSGRNRNTRFNNPYACRSASYIIWCLAQIATYYKTVAEIIINRVLEEPNKFCESEELYQDPPASDAKRLAKSTRPDLGSIYES